jgi:hypothetical protein
MSRHSGGTGNEQGGTVVAAHYHQNLGRGYARKRGSIPRASTLEKTEIAGENFIACGFHGGVVLRIVERARAQPGRSGGRRRGRQNNSSGSNRRAHAVVGRPARRATDRCARARNRSALRGREACIHGTRTCGSERHVVSACGAAESRSRPGQTSVELIRDSKVQTMVFETGNQALSMRLRFLPYGVSIVLGKRVSFVGVFP